MLMRRISVLAVLVIAIVMLASCATKTVSQPGLIERLDEAASYISSRTGGREIEVGLVLGSGLGELGGEVEDAVIIRYEDIPYFPVSTVESHAGQLVIGTLEGKSVICMQGRVHYYEGYEMAQLVFPLQVMRRLGVETVIITNSAGCVNADWEEGSLMLITDHIKLTTDNPLRGPNADELGERCFDRTTGYDKDLPFDGCVIAMGVKPNFELVEEFENAFDKVVAAGDVVNPGNIADATHAGFDKGFVF